MKLTQVSSRIKSILKAVRLAAYVNKTASITSQKLAHSILYKSKTAFLLPYDPEITSFAPEKAKIFLKKTLDGSGISSILSLQDLI